MPKRKRLTWCGTCKENSVVMKVYQRKVGLGKGTTGRVEYCLNHCGYTQALPDIKEVQSV